MCIEDRRLPAVTMKILHRSILLFDSRSGKKTAVQRSATGAMNMGAAVMVQGAKNQTANIGGHSYPVYALQHVGTQNANQLISVSTDGKICIWYA